MLFVSESYQNTSMRVPFSLESMGRTWRLCLWSTVPGEEVSPGVGVESHGILHCELLEEKVHTGLAYTLHTARFYRFDDFERLVLVGSVTKLCRVQ
jgi:hypothetical protein